jgi:hypothetical protein
VLSETVLVLVIESRMLWQGDEDDYEHRDAEHEHEHDEILLLVAFSCALRRDELDGSESGARFDSSPNRLRSSGSRPCFAFLCNRASLLC